MRQKASIDLKKTDRELFDSMPSGDCWVDARLPEVFLYLLQSHRLTVPDSWQQSMLKMKREAEQFANRPQVLFVTGAAVYCSVYVLYTYIYS